MNNSKRRQPNEDEKRAAERIRKIWLSKKRELGLTQERAAELVGWTQGGFNAYINARSPLTLQAVLKFSKLLDVSPSELAPEIIDSHESEFYEAEKIGNSELPPKTQLELKEIMDLLLTLPADEVEFIWKMVKARKEFHADDGAELIKPEGNPVAGETTISGSRSKKKVV